MNLHMNSYVITFLDMNTKNVHTATAKFCLRPSYKRIPSHKMFASDDKMLSLKDPCLLVTDTGKKRTFFFTFVLQLQKIFFNGIFLKVILLVEIRSFLVFSKPENKNLGY